MTRQATTSLAIGTAAALAIAIVWVGLTALTGKTYHLAPLLAAAAPGAVLRISAPRRAGRTAVLGAGLGLAVVAAAWAAIGLLGIEPGATVLHGQPGGVAAEVLAGALAGAVLGFVLVLGGSAATSL